MGEATRGALGAVMVVATTLTRSARSDIFHCVNFLGWHRHKKEWLDPWRKLYIDQRTAWYTTLSPVSGGCGLSMVVLPIDDATRPSKVFVIEVAQPILGTDDIYRGEGILRDTPGRRHRAPCARR